MTTPASSSDDPSEDRHMEAAKSVLDKLFRSCQSDPRGSVHRAWGISLLFVVLFFVLAVVESEYCSQSCNREKRSMHIFLTQYVTCFKKKTCAAVNLHKEGGSTALVIASVWTGIVHLALGVLGTFVLKRFPTSFSVGFLLGIMVVLANQNLILFGAFSRYRFGNPRTNHAFAILGFILFGVLSFMTLLLVHFRQAVVVAPLEVNKPKEGGGEVAAAGGEYAAYHPTTGGAAVGA
jgi:hypothetical protein